MTESKTDKFRRLRDQRLPRTLKEIELLTNLAGSNYEHTKAEAEDLINQVRDAVEGLAEAYKIVMTTSEPTPAPIVQIEQPEPIEGNMKLGPMDVSDVRWALDMIGRKELDEAKALLKRAIKGEPRPWPPAKYHKPRD